MRKRAQRLCNTFGIKMRSNEKPGMHLPFEHPQLERVRTFVKTAAAKHKCHERLILNFDQVWSTLFRPQKACLQKAASLRNLQSDPHAKSLYMRQIRHNLERVLDLPLTEKDPKAGDFKHEPKRPMVTGMNAASATVDGWRNPRTLTTLSFIDGYMGRVFVTFRERGISQATRELVNEKYGKFLFVAEPQPSSHVWSEGTLIHYLDFLAGEIRCRRAQLGLTGADRALVLMDQAGAHMSKTYFKLQKKWCLEHNVAT